MRLVTDFPGIDICDGILFCLCGINYCMNLDGRQNFISYFKNCKCPPLSLLDSWQQIIGMIWPIGYLTLFWPWIKWHMEKQRLYLSTGKQTGPRVSSIMVTVINWLSSSSDNIPTQFSLWGVGAVLFMTYLPLIAANSTGWFSKLPFVPVRSTLLFPKFFFHIDLELASTLCSQEPWVV